jgi:hypothetical protein
MVTTSLHEELLHRPSDTPQAGYVSLDHVELLADAYRAEHAAVWDRVIPLIVEFVDGSRFADVARHEPVNSSV